MQEKKYSYIIVILSRQMLMFLCGIEICMNNKLEPGLNQQRDKSLLLTIRMQVFEKRSNLIKSINKCFICNTQFHLSIVLVSQSAHFKHSFSKQEVITSSSNTQFDDFFETKNLYWFLYLQYVNSQGPLQWSLKQYRQTQFHEKKSQIRFCKCTYQHSILMFVINLNYYSSKK